MQINWLCCILTDRGENWWEYVWVRMGRPRPGPGVEGFQKCLQALMRIQKVTVRT
jgi:hypothetical protein